MVHVYALSYSFVRYFILFVSSSLLQSIKYNIFYLKIFYTHIKKNTITRKRGNKGESFIPKLKRDPFNPITKKINFNTKQLVTTKHDGKEYLMKEPSMVLEIKKEGTLNHREGCSNSFYSDRRKDNYQAEHCTVQRKKVERVFTQVRNQPTNGNITRQESSYKPCQ